MSAAGPSQHDAAASDGPRRAWPVRVLRRMARLAVERGSTAALAAAIPLGRWLTRRRVARGRERTLWGITPILTLPLKARADRALDLRSESLVLASYYIGGDFTWNISQLLARIGVKPPSGLAFHRLLLAAALLRYDIIHLFADRGILPSDQGYGIHPDELAALQRAGKRLYVFAYGADVRTRERTLALGAWNFCRDCTTPGRFCVCDETAGTRHIARTAASATALIALGDMPTYMPRARHLAYWPIDPARLASPHVPEQARSAERLLRIAHAPNHTHFKGTAYLEAAIARLQARGVPIELVRISGVPNAEVLRLFNDADLVADQLIGGAYGYAALEAMAQGRPVLTYVRSPDLVVAPEECPLLNATPDTLERTLEWCAANPDALARIGAQGRAWVARHHVIDAVAARFARLYIETAGLSPARNASLEALITAEQARSAAIAQVDGWHHPFMVTDWREPQATASPQGKAA